MFEEQRAGVERNDLISARDEELSRRVAMYIGRLTRRLCVWGGFPSNFSLSAPSDSRLRAFALCLAELALFPSVAVYRRGAPFPVDNDALRNELHLPRELVLRAWDFAANPPFITEEEFGAIESTWARVLRGDSPTYELPASYCATALASLHGWLDFYAGAIGVRRPSKRTP